MRGPPALPAVCRHRVTGAARVQLIEDRDFRSHITVDDAVDWDVDLGELPIDRARKTDLGDVAREGRDTLRERFERITLEARKR